MNKGAHLARLFLLDESKRVEILDLCGKAHREFFDIELLDVIHAAATLQERRPGGLDRIPNRRHQTDACHHNATFQDEYSLMQESQSLESGVKSKILFSL